MSSSPVAAAAHLGEPGVVEVSDGVYAYIQPDGSWWINNTGFLAGSR
ncbi:MAG: cyclase, partial [Pseudonocardiales bacterium]|nr:cyclase [Pseudonocardiales bacterium]